MKTCALAMLVVLAAVSVAQGALDFVAVNTTPFPINTLVPFDALNPAAANPASPSATLPGAFIRGIAMEDADSGWFIQTQVASGQGQRGIWRMDNGVSTLVGAQPFGDSSDTGGLSFSRGRDFLWAVIDPPGAGSANDSLYRIDFNGTYSLIGEVQIAGYGNSIRISGLAVSPVTGLMYALDTLRDALYKIDPLTATGEVVGTGLGQNFDNLTGGLDFTLDGSRLIAATNRIGSSVVYEIDFNSGLAIETLGILPFSTSGISAIPEPSSLLLSLIALVIGRRR